MKTFLSLILLSILILRCNVKPEKNKSEKSDVFSRKDNFSDEIGFACSESGIKTKTVKEFSSYLEYKDFQHIESLLYSSKAGERYLATIICKKLSDKGLITLTKEDLRQIRINEMSTDKVLTCSGCIKSDVYTLKYLLNSKENFTSIETENWLNREIK